MSFKSARQRIDKASKDPQFLEWMSHMDTELAAYLREDTPAGFPHDDPYGPEALRVVSHDLADRFPTWNALYDDPDLAGYRDRLLRYFGQAWVEAFEGEWINLPAADDLTDPWEMGPSVRLPFFELYHCPMDKVKQLLNLRELDLFTFVHANMTKKHQRWIEAGRPPLDEFSKWR